MIFLEQTLDKKILEWLISRGIVEENPAMVHVSKAGEGNMNVVMRLCTPQRSLILKQSRPYVHKFPHVEAPLERIQAEYAFYEAVNESKALQKYHPKILGFWEDNHLLILEDLGSSADLLGAYKNPALFTYQHLISLASYLSYLHGHSPVDFYDNSGMKLLNHQHVFSFPFRKDTGFNLDSVQAGLEKVAQRIRSNKLLLLKINALGERYNRTGKQLLHGDFYPGSILQTGSGLKVIDPEFCFLGDPEFDLGVFLAHLFISDYPEATCFLDHYSLEYDRNLVYTYAGTEILRRLLGLAQLPLNISLERKQELCELAVDLID
jgi:5-methylthioribose kinase